MSGHEIITMRRFVLVRHEDVSGTSGTGIVAEGVEFSNGQVVLHWTTQLESVAVYANSKVLEQVHGHGGRTKVKWIDKLLISLKENIEKQHVINEQSNPSTKKCQDSDPHFGDGDGWG